MAWTTTKTWTTSDVHSAANWNTYVRDNEQYLYDRTANKPGIRVFFYGTFNIPAASNTQLNFAGYRWGPAGMWSNASPGNVFAPVAGVYRAGMSLRFPAGTGYRILHVGDGSLFQARETIPADNTAYNGNLPNTLLALTAGQAVNYFVYASTADTGAGGIGRNDCEAWLSYVGE